MWNEQNELRGTLRITGMMRKMRIMGAVRIMGIIGAMVSLP